MARTFAAVVIVVLLVGCAGRTQTYQVMVRNESPRSVTVWLTKNAPPFEPGWRTPEQIAIATLGQREPFGGVIIPPGKIGETGRVRGRFPEGVDAVLRVYLGQLSFDDMLAVSRGSPDRIDVVLEPGTNELIVRDRRGRIIIDRAAAPEVARNE